MLRCEVAVIGSGFSGALTARILRTLGYDVALLERGTHPRFAIGESSTPLANLSLERLARRYDLDDCYQLAAHGRWVRRLPEIRRGLKRGFTFYRHHPGQPLAPHERMLVAASPSDHVADTHWLRADVDHHFVRQAVAAGVAYLDRVELKTATFDGRSARLSGVRLGGEPVDVRANFVIDASGPAGFLARTLRVPSGARRTVTRSALLFSHFENVRLVSDIAGGLSDGPYPDDWAAVHHLIDEGWMYSLRFDHGVTSAGFTLSPRGLSTLTRSARDANVMWCTLLGRYPTIAAAFGDARPVMPIAFRDGIQHRLTRAAGERWLLLPHTFAFVDPLFSTGIAWSLRAVERVALAFEPDSRGRRRRAPRAGDLARYDELLAAEADQIDRLVAGAYDAMGHFDLFAAHALIYFAMVSFAEVQQRVLAEQSVAWRGFLGVGDAALHTLPNESRRRLRRITRGEAREGSAMERRRYVEWVKAAIATRNIGGFGDPARHNLYPVDLDLLVERHALLGLSRDQLLAALPLLRGGESTR